MKDYKSDAGAALSRFAKDKRLRHDNSAHAEHEGNGEQHSHRRSYNPNFTEDNRLKGRDAERKSFGEHSRYGEHKPFERERKPFDGERKSGERTFGEHKPFGRKPFDKEHKPFERERKPFDGERKSGERTFGEHKSFGRKPFDKEHKPFDRDRKPFGGERKAFGKPYSRDERRGGDDKPKSYPKYNPNHATDEIRLNRFVAQSGLCSRREADDYIAAGLVSVNGEVVTTLGTKVKPTDEVRFNDERIKGEKNVYLILNKPKGYVTTLEDEHAAKTVMELVKDACTERIYPVGRLDKNSLGLLMFTNDGDITRQLTHPSYKKKKIYEVTLDKPLTRADFDQLAEGITLEDGDAFFDEISYLKDDKKSVGVEIHSGRNRIVRRMFEHLGYTVTKLDRVYYAGLTKKNLKRGAWRFLTDEEVNRLKSGRYE